jgi:hypothetical protein
MTPSIGDNGRGLWRGVWNETATSPLKATETDLARTLRAIATRYWAVVLVYPRTKIPAAAVHQAWPITRDPEEVHAHVRDRGGNVGLLGGEINGLALVDVDDPGAFAEMEKTLRPLGAPWVLTGRGRAHIYVRWEGRLPAKLRWCGAIVGEIQRGPGQQMLVCPPSRHPDTGRRYSWLVEPDTPIVPRLSARWREYLLEPARPTYRWSDPETGVHASAAIPLPGARRRPGGKIKFQCPACAAEGHDLHADNAVYFQASGTWGCAYASGRTLGRTHWEAIGQMLGLLPAPRRRG